MRCLHFKRKVESIIRKLALLNLLAVSTALLFILLIPLSVDAIERSAVIMLGDRDEYVLKLQKELCSRGYLKTEPTGYFGVETQHALTRYQERNKLKADGKAGPGTLKKIFGKNYKPLPSSRVVMESTTRTDDSSGDICPGDNGNVVQSIQTRLKTLRYYQYSKITAYYGPQTETAVRAFQKSNNLTVDGVVGTKTYEAIFASSAVEASLEVPSNEKSADAQIVQSPGLVKAQEDLQTIVAQDKGKADLLIDFGKTLLGKGYRPGAEGPNSFDCSGFVYYCLRNRGIKAPRSSADQSCYEGWTKIVDKSSLLTGDILFFKTRGHPKGVGHSGIYIGNGKFIHSSTGKGVIISDLMTGYYLDHYQWARRIFN